MNVLILDDCLNNAEILGKEIKALAPNFNILCFDDYKDFLCTLNNFKQCIIFMDIVMPKISGIEISNLIKKSNYDPPIILYSGMPKEQYDVYDCHHIYFLEKPFETEKIKKAIQLAIAYLEDYFFTYTFAKMTIKIPFSSIVYFESKGKKVRIVTTSETKYYYDQIDELEKRINYPFIRVNKSFFVNPKYILLYQQDIILKPINNPDSTNKISVSRKYKENVLNYELFIKHH